MRTINKALFLDLDGTLIVTKSGKTFPVDKDDWQFNKNIIECIEKYVDAGYYIMVVSNQGGIEAGIVKLNDFRQKIRKIMNDLIVATGLPLSRVAYRFSVSNNAEDFFRKPNPGMAYDLALSNILNLSECVMVGDASGKIRKRRIVIAGSKKGTWYYADVTPAVLVPGEDFAKHEFESTGTHSGEMLIRDFADSDLKFAKASGMKYYDIEEFLTNKTI